MYENGNEQKKKHEKTTTIKMNEYGRDLLYIYIFIYVQHSGHERNAIFRFNFFPQLSCVWVYYSNCLSLCVCVLCWKIQSNFRCVLFLSRFISFSVSLWLCVFNQQVTSASRSVSQWVSDAMRPMIMMMNRFYSMTNLSLLLYFVFVLSWHFSNTFLVFIHNYTLYTCRYSDTSFFSILTLSVIHLKFITMWESLDLHDGIRNDCTLNSF